jgi:lipopolysaccharide transport system permease protein
MELVIKPQKALKIDWKELWAYRELFYFFAWRDIKVRYKQTVIGAAWAIFQPFVTMIVFTIFFNKVAGIESPHGIPYAIFSYTALLFWNVFVSSLNNSSNSLLASQGIITKIYFPRIIAPFSATIVALIDFFFAFLVYVALMLYYHIIPGGVGVLLFLPMLLLTLITSSGLGLFFAALNVKFRDVRFVVPFLTHMLLFLTPIIYPVSLVPERFQWILYLNPMTGVIQTIRAGTLHEGSVQWGLLGLSLVVALSIFVIGVNFFKRQERNFADFI